MCWLAVNTPFVPMFQRHTGDRVSGLASGGDLLSSSTATVLSTSSSSSGSARTPRPSAACRLPQPQPWIRSRTRCSRRRSCVGTAAASTAAPRLTDSAQSATRKPTRTGPTKHNKVSAALSGTGQYRTLPAAVSHLLEIRSGTFLLFFLSLFGSLFC